MTQRRLVQIDALRGIAAMMVVLFHYTTRYDELYSHTSPPAAALPAGYLGVNLFFMISGFVIFMTLDSTRKSLDFVVSRCSRLFPAYWVAVLVTFSVVHLIGLPGKEVPVFAMLVNLSMLQGFFGVAAVDGVYWTLSVELIFYGWALLCYRLSCLHRVPLLLTLLLAIRLVYFIAAQVLHKDLPWIGYQFLILHYIPWFASGISIFRMSTGKGAMPSEIGVICAAALILLITDGWPPCLLLLVLSVILYAAASDKLIMLNGAIPRFLGDISYALYLLHENIGWALMRRMEEEGMATNLAILLALVISVSLATIVNRLIERPAMHWLRDAYRRRQLVTVGTR